MPPKAKKPAKVGLADLTIGNAVACGACSPFKMKTVVQEGKEKKSKKDAPSAAAMDVVSVDELNQKIATLEKEKNKEEEYRNYMQLERVSCICKYAFTPLRCLFKCYVQPLLECPTVPSILRAVRQPRQGPNFNHTSCSMPLLLTVVVWESFRSLLIFWHSAAPD